MLVVLAEQLGTFVQYVGGPEYAPLLLKTLEGLVSADEPIVRETAVESLGRVAALFDGAKLSAHMVPMIRRLAAGAWFPQKTSVAALIGVLLERIEDGGEAAELRRIFADLAGDETAIVRKAVLNNLARVIRATAKDLGQVVDDLVPVLVRLAADPQDAVRLLLVTPLIALGEAMRHDPALLAQHVVPLFTLLSGDRSWRIRYMLAKQFAPLTMLLTAGSGEADPVRTFLALLKDAEPEVRTAAAGQLVAVARPLHPDEVRARLLPALPGVASDPSPHVKAALASCLNDLSPVIGPEAAIEHVLPLLVKLLADESSEVRLNVVGGLEETVQVIGIEPLYDELLPAVSRLSQDPQWRVREMIIGIVPTLARLLGHQRYEARLADLGLSWLDDPVWQVRRAAAQCHALLVKTFGTRWALESGLVERLLQLAGHPNYLRRQTCLVLVSDLLAAGVALDYVSVGLVVPVLEGLRHDAVANVRIALARTIRAIAPVLLADRPDLLRETCLPILQQLARDQDADVQFHAEQALQVIP